MLRYLLASAVVVLSLSACEAAGKAKKKAAPAPAAATDNTALFKLLDTNKDGVISLEEFKKLPALPTTNGVKVAKAKKAAGKAKKAAAAGKKAKKNKKSNS